MASSTLDPTVPIPSESEGNGRVRIIEVKQALLALFGQSTSAAFTWNNNPFVIDASGNVNITQAAGFTIGGNPTISSRQLYKHADQTITGGATENILILPIGANEVWTIRFVLFTDPHSGGGFTITPSVPVGATYKIAMPGGAWSSSSLAAIADYLPIDLTVINGASAGNVTLVYSAVFVVTKVLALSTMFAIKVI